MLSISSRVELFSNLESQEAETLKLLRSKLFDELSQYRGGQAIRAARLRNQLAPKCVAVVGKFEEVTVGYCLLSFDHFHRVLSIDEMYVDPNARGIGVGDDMETCLRTYAHEIDAVAIDACALPGMRDTKNFFEAHSYISRVLIMRRNLDSSDSNANTSTS